MTTEKKATEKSKAIVMPFQAEKGGPFNGTGMALHFMLGNVLVLNDNLKEMWFGWRVGKIFPERKLLTDFCRGGGTPFDYRELGEKQKVRFWFSGSVDTGKINLELCDASGASEDSKITIPFVCKDRLVDFRGKFMEWTAGTGIEFDPAQREAALWPEALSEAGLDAVGLALEAFYIYSAYGGEGGIDLAPFQAAVNLSPNSFMAQDLLGWALYRNETYAPAKTAFLTALRENPQGAGAMAGMMWCGVMTQDKDEATYWSARKAEVCKGDVEAAREKALRLLKKYS